MYHSDSGLDSCTRLNTDDSGLIYSSIYINHKKNITLCEVLSREFWSWKFRSAGPKFSLENMVRLCKNWSELKTLVLRLLS